MALNDSLEILNDDVTFRVDYPLPYAVENEEEFITNSGRKLKKHTGMEHMPYQQHGDDQTVSHHQNIQNDSFKNPLIPPEMSDSLQAELHLSLDRLSENSYDQDDLNRIKLKSQSGQRHTKTYPVVGNLSQVKDFNIQQQMGKHSVLSHGIPIKSVTNMPASNEEEEYVDDDDDIHTVVVDDSLSFNEGGTSLSTEKHKRNHGQVLQKQIEHLQEDTDLYSYLRYNPEWRGEDDDDVSPAKENVFDAASQHPHSKTDELEQNSLLHSPNPQGGAIIVHNHEFLEFKDSPVRLSTDPSRLLRMNQKYEEEFHRMLEQEQHWHDPIEDPPSLQDDLEKENKTTLNSKSKLKPPISYKTFVQEDAVIIKPPTIPTPSANTYSQSSPASDQAHSATIGSSPKQQKPASVTSSKTTGSSTIEKRSSVAPTPPKAPKSNRDYIELNRIRLGRKSNSASYLEMYSKKNRILDQTKSTPRRPMSDVRRKEDKASPALKKPVPNLNPNENPAATVEEQWKEQAQRLRLAKEGKSPNSMNSKRNTLREMGNQGGVKPSLSPRLLVGGSPQYPTSPQHSPGGAASPKHKRNLSPRRDINPSPKSDFAHHPAFSPFSRPESYTREQFETDSFSNKYSDPNQDNFQSISHTTPYYNNEPYQLPGRQPSSTNQQNTTSGYTSEMGSVPTHGFHQVRQQDVQNFHPSPMMQAYHQHFGPSRTSEVPHQHYLSSYYQAQYEENIGGQQHHNEKKLPLPSHKYPQEEMTYNYSPDGERLPWNETDSPIESAVYKNFDLTRNHSVPRLPPILGASQISPKQNESIDDKKDVALRKSLSDSEALGVGSYLQQHEKKKMKPSYKRYTLEDYKSLKRDINMGGLGPDLLNSKMKMEKMNRAKKYSEFIRKQHKTNVVNLQNNSLEDLDEKYYPLEMKQRFTLGDADHKREELQERRQKALDYARQVPKPKPIAPVPSDYSRTVSHESCELEDSNQAPEWELLRNLRDRHEREKAIVAEMTSPHRVT